MIATSPEVKPTGRYSLAETGKLLGLSTRTIQRYVEDNTIKANVWKLNNKTFVTGLEIMRVWNATI